MERILVRLGIEPPGQWVLKGGMAMEVRMPDKARTTRDLDLATRHAIIDDADLGMRLGDLLARDDEGDRFTFDVTAIRHIEALGPERPTRRLRLSSRLAGRPFVDLRVDVSARVTELGFTEPLVLPNSLDFDGFPAHDFETVSASQHFAEKLHALTRDYGRENTRTRDLVDLVLLITNGLVTPASVLPAVVLVFQDRAAHPVPIDLQDPPRAWAEPFARMAAEVGLEVSGVPSAMAIVRAFWADALDQDRAAR